MSIFLTIIAVIVIFSILVLIHEYGHFIAARRSGIRVLEFGIGFPPRLFKKKIGETTYSINAIPFGGFVKLYGEDSSDRDVLSDKRSFASKTPWVRTKVILAGVFMNLLLAIGLLTIGFSFGIEPLLVTQADLYAHIEKGSVLTMPGAFIAKVSGARSQLPIHEGDQLLAINDAAVSDPSQLAIFSKGGASGDVDLTLRARDGTVKKTHVPVDSKKRSLGIELKPFTDFPRLTIHDVKPGSRAARAGVQAGDVLLKLNGQHIYDVGSYGEIVASSGLGDLEVLRAGTVVALEAAGGAAPVVIAEVFPASAAQKAGIQKGDILEKIEGEAIATPQHAQAAIKAAGGKPLAYELIRRGKRLTVKAAPGADKLLGIALSSLAPYQNSDLSLYRDSVLTSIIEIKNVRYAPWNAFLQAISESVRLTGITIAAFGRTIGSLVSKFAVPGDIGGPVQIAYYTHTFIQEGLFAVLRFMALLSLSLAVINVLPIPALDGGRFLFIVIEVITKRRINARLESIVHMIGFVLLILMIVAVTYSDITKLF